MFFSLAHCLIHQAEKVNGFLHLNVHHAACVLQGRCLCVTDVFLVPAFWSRGLFRCTAWQDGRRPCLFVSLITKRVRNYGTEEPRCADVCSSSLKNFFPPLLRYFVCQSICLFVESGPDENSLILNLPHSRWLIVQNNTGADKDLCVNKEIESKPSAAAEAISPRFKGGSKYSQRWRKRDSCSWQDYFTDHSETRIMSKRAVVPKHMLKSKQNNTWVSYTQWQGNCVLTLNRKWQ